MGFNVSSRTDAARATHHPGADRAASWGSLTMSNRDTAVAPKPLVAGTSLPFPDKVAGHDVGTIDNPDAFGRRRPRCRLGPCGSGVDAGQFARSRHRVGRSRFHDTPPPCRPRAHPWSIARWRAARRSPGRTGVGRQWSARRRPTGSHRVAAQRRRSDSSCRPSKTLLFNACRYWPPAPRSRDVLEVETEPGRTRQSHPALTARAWSAPIWRPMGPHIGLRCQDVTPVAA